LNHGELTDIIGVEPTSVWFKGDDTLQGTHVKKKETGWEYSTGFRPTFLVDEIVSEVYQLLKPSSKELSKYLQEHDLKLKFFVVIEMTNDIKPGLYFSAKFIQLAAELNAPVDIDLYSIND